MCQQMSNVFSLGTVPTINANLIIFYFVDSSAVSNVRTISMFIVHSRQLAFSKKKVRLSHQYFCSNRVTFLIFYFIIRSMHLQL